MLHPRHSLTLVLAALLLSAVAWIGSVGQDIGAAHADQAAAAAAHHHPVLAAPGDDAHGTHHQAASDGHHHGTLGCGGLGCTPVLLATPQKPGMSVQAGKRAPANGWPADGHVPDTPHGPPRRPA